MCVVILAVAVMLFWGVQKYLDEVPVITPKANVTVQTGSIVTADDLAVIEREVIRKGVYCVTETDLAQEKDHMLYIGDKEGELTVSVSATGVNHESREAQVTIRIVKAD